MTYTKADFPKGTVIELKDGSKHEVSRTDKDLVSVGVYLVDAEPVAPNYSGTKFARIIGPRYQARLGHPKNSSRYMIVDILTESYQSWAWVSKRYAQNEACDFMSDRLDAARCTWLPLPKPHVFKAGDRVKVSQEKTIIETVLIEYGGKPHIELLGDLNIAIACGWVVELIEAAKPKLPTAFGSVVEAEGQKIVRVGAAWVIDGLEEIAATEIEAAGWTLVRDGI